MPYRLEIVVFVSGAAVMMLEIVASRILAPYFGTSTFVWTSVIGVILASLSAGYYWGGKLADRSPRPRILSALLFGSALLVAGAVALHFILLSLIQKLGLDLRIAAVLSTSILFGPASVILGMVSPFAARLRMDAIATSGATLGRLYALSTLGSIVGTFAAGFWLIAIVGSITLLLLVSVLLLTISLLVALPDDRVKVIAAIVLVLGGIFIYRDYKAYAESTGFIDIDTQYSRVFIYDEKESDSNRTVRMMMFDPFGVQSGIYVDNPSETIEWMKYSRVSKHFSPNPSRVLVIGGAAFSVVRDLMGQFPKATIDVVEIDPGLTELAKKHFGLTPDPRLNIIHEDGRTYLNRSREIYDLLFIDAFNSSSSIPFQLVTVEAFERYRSLLSPSGILVINSMGRIKGPGEEFLAALYSTMSSVFSQVAVFPWYGGENSQLRQNIILVGSNANSKFTFTSDNAELKELLSKLYTGELPRSSTGLFTDNFAPAELYAARLVGNANK